MRQCHQSAVRVGVNHGVANVAGSELPAGDFGDVQRLGARRHDQAQVNRARGLQLHFQELVANVRKTPVVLVAGIAERLANEPVQSGTAVAVLVKARVFEGDANQLAQARTQRRDRQQAACARLIDGAGFSCVRVGGGYGQRAQQGGVFWHHKLGLERWLRLSEHRISFDKWSPAGLTSVQSCPRWRSDGACDVPADRRGGQLVFTVQAARLIAGSVAK